MRAVAASIAAFSLALAAAGCGGSDTKVGFPAAVKLSAPKDCTETSTQFTHLVVTYTGAKPATGGSTIQEDFPCHGP